MNEEKTLREEITEMKRLVNDIAAKLYSLEIDMKKHSIETVMLHDGRWNDKQIKD